MTITMKWLIQAKKRNLKNKKIGVKPIWFTTPTAPLRNQAILATRAISFITTPYCSKCFLAINSPMLSSKLNSLETKLGSRMMVITSHFKDELLSLKKYYYARCIDLCVTALLSHKFTPVSDNCQTTSIECF